MYCAVQSPIPGIAFKDTTALSIEFAVWNTSGFFAAAHVKERNVSSRDAGMPKPNEDAFASRFAEGKACVSPG